MHQGRADTARAVVLSLLLHVALFALVFVGLWWTRATAPPSAAGSAISAELVDAGNLSSSVRRMLAQQPEPLPPAPEPEPEPSPEPIPEAAPELQPVPEPIPEDAPIPPQPAPQLQVPEPAPVDQAEARRDAIAKETAEREAEEKRRQEQIDLDEKRKQEEAEQKRRLAAEQKRREVEKQLAELKKKQEQAQREREQLERNQRRIEQSRAEAASEQAAAGAPAPPGNAGVDDGLGARYQAALMEAILRNWTRPDNVPLGQVCRMTITQVRGGTVVRVEFAGSCPYDELGRRSVEAAVRKAEPLPYAGFESVFNRTLNLNFRAEDR